MRTQARSTTDPDCRLSTPWTGLTLAQQCDLIRSLGGRVAAADHFQSVGHSAHFERNRRIRETRLQGRAVDLDRDDLSSPADPRRHGRGQRRAPLAPARLLDCDAWSAILGAVRAIGADIPHPDVLVASAQQGKGATAAIAEEVGISQKHVRNCQNIILAWTRAHVAPEEIARHLDDPITTEVVTRRPPSRAGRKPKGWALQAAWPVAPAARDLLGDPIDLDHPPRKMRAVQVRGPRRPRVRPVCEGQMAFDFDMAA